MAFPPFSYLPFLPSLFHLFEYIVNILEFLDVLAGRPAGGSGLSHNLNPIAFARAVPLLFVAAFTQLVDSSLNPD